MHSGKSGSISSSPRNAPSHPAPASSQVRSADLFALLAQDAKAATTALAARLQNHRLPAFDLNASPNGQTLLHAALAENNAAFARLLLKHGAKVGIAEKATGDTALHLAARADDHAMVAKLLRISREQNINLVLLENRAGETALCIAAAGNAAATLAVLLGDIRLDIGYVNLHQAERCPTAFHLAAANNAHASLRLMLGHIRAFGRLAAMAILDRPNTLGYTPLSKACEAGAVQAAAMLMQADAALHGNPVEPLHEAVKAGSAELARILLAEAHRRGGVELVRRLVEHINPGGSNALALAFKGGNVDVLGGVVRAMVRAGCEEGQFTVAFHKAIDAGSISLLPDYLELLTEQGGPAAGKTCLESLASDGEHTALTRAVMTRNRDALLALLGLGADFGKTNSSGHNFFHLLVYLGDVETFKAANAIARGLDASAFGVAIDAIDACGHSPLTLALHLRHVEMFQFLSRACTRIDTPGVDHKSPLHLAAANPEAQFATAIIERMASDCSTLSASEKDHAMRQLLDATDATGSTALMIAGGLGQLEIVKLLLRHGANPALQSASGNTVLHEAVIEERLEVVRQLLEGTDFDAQELRAFVNIKWNGHGAISMAISKPDEYMALIRVAGGTFDDLDQRGRSVVLAAAAGTGREVLVEEIIAMEVACHERGPLPDLELLAAQSLMGLAGENGITGPKQPPQPDLSGLLEFECDEGITALWVALNGGHKSIADRLIAAGACLSGKPSASMLPIHLAARKGYDDIVEKIIDAARAGQGDDVESAARLRAFVDVPSLENSLTPLQLAIDAGQVHVVRLLVQHGAQLCMVTQSPAGDDEAGGELSASSAAGVLMQLGDHAAPDDLPMVHGESDAVSESGYRIDDSDSASSEGSWESSSETSSEYHLARLDCVELLVALSSDLRIVEFVLKSLNTQQPGVLAGGASTGAAAGASLLTFLQRRGRGEETPLLAAARAGLPGTVRLLLEHGASLSDTDANGNSAFHLAAREDRHQSLALLLAVVQQTSGSAEAGRRLPSRMPIAPLFQINGDGFTPLELALQARAEATTVALLKVSDIDNAEIGAGDFHFCIEAVANRQGPNLLATLLENLDPSSLEPEFADQGATLASLKSMAQQRDFESMLPLLQAIDSSPFNNIDRASLAQARSALETGEHLLIAQLLAKMGHPCQEPEAVFVETLRPNVRDTALLMALLPAIDNALLLKLFSPLLSLALSAGFVAHEGRKLVDAVGSMFIDYAESLARPGANGIDVQLDQELLQRMQAVLSLDHPDGARVITSIVFAAVKRHDLILHPKVEIDRDDKLILQTLLADPLRMKEKWETRAIHAASSLRGLPPDGVCDFNASEVRLFQSMDKSHHRPRADRVHPPAWFIAPERLLLKTLFTFPDTEKADAIRSQAVAFIRQLDASGEKDQLGGMIDGFKVLPEKFTYPYGLDQPQTVLDRQALERLPSMGAVSTMLAALDFRYDARFASRLEKFDSPTPEASAAAASPVSLQELRNSRGLTASPRPV
ncbi:MAG: ankyrin repeat domain-containing protein [Janthinobacterium lividum]